MHTKRAGTQSCRLGLALTSVSSLVLINTVFLSLGEAQFQETVQGYVSIRVQRQAEPSSNESAHGNETAKGNVSDQQSPDGYISTEELHLLMFDFGLRDEIRRDLNQVRFTPPEKFPMCSHDSMLYDPINHVCGRPYTPAHCGENMIFKRSSTAGAGSCTCGDSFGGTAPCWGIPSIIVGNKCYEVATQGTCAVGEVLVPADRYSVKCALDACLHGGPKNAINFSTWSHKKDSDKNVWDVHGKPFLFTYKKECYMTETEAFCEPGKVVRFLLPYKSPFCVPRDYDFCIGLQFRLSAPWPATCEDGFQEDPVRNFCVETASLKFD